MPARHLAQRRVDVLGPPIKFYGVRDTDDITLERTHTQVKFVLASRRWPAIAAALETTPGTVWASRRWWSRTGISAAGSAWSVASKTCITKAGVAAPTNVKRRHRPQARLEHLKHHGATESATDRNNHSNPNARRNQTWAVTANVLFKLMRGNRKWMTGKTPVHGKQPEAFLLSLDEQQFVERILVIQRRLKLARGMKHGHRQKRHLLLFESGDDAIWRKAALAQTRRVAGIVLEADLLDRNRTHIKLRLQQLSRPVHEVEQV